MYTLSEKIISNYFVFVKFRKILDEYYVTTFPNFNDKKWLRFEMTS